MTTSRTKLKQATLPNLGQEIQVPAYDRDGLQQVIVHLGIGGFHRAHQAVYLDDLLALPDTPRWSECGIGVLESDLRMRDILQDQNFLYTVVERSASKQSARVIGSLTGYIYAPEDRKGAIEKMAAAATRIVSLTITEGGYYIDEATGAFLSEHPDIEHDLLYPNEPRSSIGLMAEALDRRRRRGLPGFTILSCDNLQGNGHVARRVMLEYAGLRDSALQAWIAENVAFPNSMVDRITPATTTADVAFVADRFGLSDGWPVMTEPFRQWVIEDTFSNGRPAWERVGAQLITDVAPYETMKIRLLNGSHLAIAYLGAICGFTYVHEILADPLFNAFIRAFMEEVTPVVPGIPGTSIPDYKTTLIERFSNPTINDQVTRICSEGSAKIPKWLFPSILELLEKGASVDLLTLVLASWIWYLGGNVDPTQIIDARSGELILLAKASLVDPRPMLAVKSIFSEALSENAALVEELAAALHSFADMGVRETMQQHISRKW